MATLAPEFKQVTTELPLVALARLAVAPVSCVLTLALSMLVHQEPFSLKYGLLGLIAFLVTLQVYRQIPLVNGGSRAVPGGVLVTRWLIVAGILLMIGFLMKATALYSRQVVFTWFVAAPIALHAGRALMSRLMHGLLTSGAHLRSKIVVGANDAGRELAREIARDPCRGVLKGFFDDRDHARLTLTGPGRLIGRIGDVAAYVKRHAVSVVYITLPMSHDPRIARLLDELQDTTASVYFVPSALPYEMIQARVDYIGNVPVIAVCESPLYGINGVVKRATDVLITSTLLALIWPLMVAIAVGVKCSSPGPVLFRQRRYGLDGKEILIYKFRSMTVCEDGAQVRQAKRDDDRVTAFGALLRRSSLDELPQFLNVLDGTMSIVGPRPHAVVQNEQYRKLIGGYMLRHKVRPGITGWAQINGFRGETATVDRMEKRIEYDLDYLRNWSVSLDLWIMLKTPLVLLRGHNAY